MKRIATIYGQVTFTPGDGVPIVIPEGPIEIEETEDSVILGWEQAKGVVGSTAMPRIQYDQYVEAGRIRPAE
ncbi:MAG: hypothetical protein QM586_00820 [Xenophilus sp.]